MKKAQTVSFRAPNKMIEKLKEDMRTQNLESLSDAARRRLQSSLTQDELLKEIRLLRQAQQQSHRQSQLLLFGFRKLQAFNEQLPETLSELFSELIHKPEGDNRLKESISG